MCSSETGRLGSESFSRPCFLIIYSYVGYQPFNLPLVGVIHLIYIPRSRYITTSIGAEQSIPQVRIFFAFTGR
jgi:hypothetical protein